MAKRKESKNKNNKLSQITLFVIAIIIVVVVLISLGLIPWPGRKDRILKKKKEVEERIDEIEKRIQVLEEAKQENFKKEKKVFLIARLIIGAILIILNYFIYYQSDKPLLESIVELNGAIILAYSFIAFLFYGSIETLVKTLKEKYLKALKISKFVSQSELDSLNSEKEKLKLQLVKLQEKLDQNPDQNKNLE